MEKLFLNSAIAIAKVLACSRARSSQMSTRCIQITISPFKSSWCPMNYHYVSWIFMVKLPFWMWDPKKILLKSLDESPCLLVNFTLFMLQRCPKIRQSSGPWAPDTGRLPVRVAWMAHLTPGTTKDAEKTMVSWVWNIINVHNSNFTRKKWLAIQPQKLGYSVLKD